jgi:hypothetical protein
MSTQGMDGTAHLTYYDKVHSLSFVWDGTVGNWIDVAYGGYGEAVIARIPWIGVGVDAGLLARFQSACDGFINQLHEIECGTEHEHDAVGVLE